MVGLEDAQDVLRASANTESLPATSDPPAARALVPPPGCEAQGGRRTPWGHPGSDARRAALQPAGPSRSGGSLSWGSLRWRSIRTLRRVLSLYHHLTGRSGPLNGCGSGEYSSARHGTRRRIPRGPRPGRAGVSPKYRASLKRRVPCVPCVSMEEQGGGPLGLNRGKRKDGWRRRHCHVQPEAL